jgi:putative transcriptional regulator
MTTHAQPRLATRLRVARAEHRLSQGDLARLAGVSRQTISSIETGQYCPSTILALRISRILSVQVEDLFWLEGDDDVERVPA